MNRYSIEQSIIYSALADASMVGIVAECTDVECYSDKSCRDVYRALQSLYKKSGPTDRINVGAELVRLHLSTDITDFMLILT